MKVYLWNKDGAAIFHTDLDAAAQIDGLTSAPELTVGIAEFEAAGSATRIEGGRIVFGPSDVDMAGSRFDGSPADAEAETAPKKLSA